jgi:hypothetical protein
MSFTASGKMVYDPESSFECVTIGTTASSGSSRSFLENDISVSRPWRS